MQKSNLYFTIFQKISEHLTILLNIQSKKKAGRPPKVSDLQLAALYITSYISNTPILTLARFLIYPSIQSWHLFRKSKSERVYKILREYWLRRITITMILKIVLGKKGKLIKNFNLVSRWRKIKTFVAYLYAYTIGYSFFRKVNYEGNFSLKVYKYK